MQENRQIIRERIQELTEKLNRAAREYYSGSGELMSNREYDALYDELSELEKKTGIVLSGSPTMRVGYEVLSSLPKETHERPMLSLDKTKSVEELASFVGKNEALLSWKLDGLTIVLTYEGGELRKAVTRGNGETGEVITQNAKVFKNVPLKIPFGGRLVLRGEAVISYSDFEEMNSSMEEGERYKNPRNLCSGSVRQLDSRITASRNVRFMAFSLVLAESADSGDASELPELSFGDSVEKQFMFLKEQGFDLVPYVRVTGDTVPEAVEKFRSTVADYELPSDGLVCIYDSISLGERLGRTAKFPRNSIAFKWSDEEAETTLRQVEWSPSRTGLINPVAIFDDVELEGTTVSRASVHNISILRGLKLGIGDRILVYKANMIIPQISENLTCSDTLDIPDKCPVCGEATDLRGENDTLTLHCPNAECPAKKTGAFTLFVSRDAMNIDGLSEMTLEKFINSGFIRHFADLYHLQDHRDEIVSMEGFGELSFNNIKKAVEDSRDTMLYRLIYSLGIPGIGVANAKILAAAFRSIEALCAATVEELSGISGIGPVMAAGIVEYFRREENIRELELLLPELNIALPPEPTAEGGGLAGKIFVITGSLNHFSNRDELKEKIEALGGKVTGSVSAKTTALINNDINSTSGKNKKALEAGIEIISEDAFLERYGIQV